MKLFKKLFCYLSILSIIIMITAGAYIYNDYSNFWQSKTKNLEVTDFKVKSGDGLNKILKRLSTQNIIKTSALQNKLIPYYIKFMNSTIPNKKSLKIGDYQIQPTTSLKDTIALFRSGKTIQFKIRFLEGWTFNQFRKEIKKNPNIEQTLEFVPNKDVMKILGHDGKYYEGMFFPSTYTFSKGIKDTEILEMSYNLMQKKIKNAWQKADKTKSIKSSYELLILASIIERETNVNKERNKVSSIFHNRLKLGMLLQTDPTIIYGMGENYHGKIYASNLKDENNLYNSYVFKGLPPTPISMPGESSLLAAGQPDETKYLYFVATGKGGHYFNINYKDHLKAVAKYRAELKKEK